jgi:hypothetical protein
MREPNLIAAYMLYDASIVLPAQIRDNLRKKFKAGPQTREMLLEYLCQEAHQGICSMQETDTQHFWKLDLSSGEVTGTLQETLNLAYKLLKRTETRYSACGMLARLCADGFLFLSTINFPEWDVIHYRLIENISLHVQDMPFIWDSIVQGDTYQPSSTLSALNTTQIALDKQRQSAVNVANSYLHGNGWPIAKTEVYRRYNAAVNILAESIIMGVQ